MAFFYIELNRGDANVLEGHIFRLFKDSVTPPIPDELRLARIEVTDKTFAQVRAYIRSGIGKIKIGLLPTAQKNNLKSTRTLSATASQLAPYMAVDKDPSTVTGRRFELLKDLPSKPEGTVFSVDASDPVPRVRCITDPTIWFDLYIFDSAAAQVPVKPTAAQGLDVLEF